MKLLMLGVPDGKPSPVSTALLFVEVLALANTFINLFKYAISSNLD